MIWPLFTMLLIVKAFFLTLDDSNPETIQSDDIIARKLLAEDFKEVCYHHIEKVYSEHQLLMNNW